MKSSKQGAAQLNSGFQPWRSVFFGVLIASLPGVLMSCSAGSRAATLQSAAEGWQRLRQGQYSTAIATFTTVLRTDPGDLSAQQGLLRAYLETGRYQKAVESSNRFLEKHSDNGPLAILRGEIHFAAGRYEKALAEFRKAAARGHGPQTWRARLEAGMVLLTKGRTEEAQTLFRRFISFYNSHQVTSAEALAYVGRALFFLQHYHQANDLYLDAIAANPTFIDAYLWAGELYLEKYNYVEAAGFFRDALKMNPKSARAHLGLARCKRIDGGPVVWQEINQALETNPHLVAAHNLKASLLLEEDRLEEAEAELERALRVNPHSLQAHSLRAAAYYLRDQQDDFQAEVQQVLAINPRYGRLYHTLAESAVTHRRYHQAVRFERKAIGLSPRLWKAYTTLGINLLRTGRYAEGRKVLEEAFEGDPFNLWAKNTLDLLDSMKGYRETVGKHFLVKVAAKESGVIAPYALELLEEAYRTLTAKYRFAPRGPIICEIFPHHEDFAVRTLGLPGLGALGVCFGQVMAMDSPSARPIGQFNWGSTAWHEFVHVITLQITDYKIPRWFSEGLSVYEERRARPGWGDDWTAGYLRAYAEGRFLPIAQLDGGFLRPAPPDQVPLAYFQASLICEFIDHRFGFEAILKMLQQYKQGATTRQALKRVLGLPPEQFDKAFRSYVDTSTAKYRKSVEFNLLGHGQGDVTTESLHVMLMKNPDSFFAHWRLGLIYQSAGDPTRSIEHLTRAIALFPYYTGERNPYQALADLYAQQGRPRETIKVLEQLVNIDEASYEAHDRLAWLLVEQGEVSRARAMLDRTIYINPFNAPWHRRAGEFFLGQGDADRALREFQTVLALDPPDRAEAYYNQARALLALARRAEAKRAVLRSLELAPSFDKAQRLLLRLTGRL